MTSFRRFQHQFASAIAFGTARILETVEEIKAPSLLILEKYSPDYIEDGKKYMEECRGQNLVVAIDIEHLTAKPRNKVEITPASVK
jgi:nitroimidazol reductase NimA-like FMN-containing flavoprotein (pyridoxamine 5'-phosphate oxidase superfamily)